MPGGIGPAHAHSEALWLSLGKHDSPLMSRLNTVGEHKHELAHGKFITSHIRVSSQDAVHLVDLYEVLGRMGFTEKYCSRWSYLTFSLHYNPISAVLYRFTLRTPLLHASQI